MAWQEMSKLENVHLNRGRSRIGEIHARFIWRDTVAATDVAAAEWRPQITLAEAKRLRYRPVKAPSRGGAMGDVLKNISPSDGRKNERASVE